MNRFLLKTRDEKMNDIVLAPYPELIALSEKMEYVPELKGIINSLIKFADEYIENDGEAKMTVEIELKDFKNNENKTYEKIINNGLLSGRYLKNV